MERIPWWKTALSHFTDLELQKTSSLHNQTLTVFLSRGQIKLVSDNAIYSYGIFYQNFVDAFDYLNICKKKVPEILILGLGTGSIPYILEKKCKQISNITAIEWDPRIIGLYNRWVKPLIHSQLLIVEQDAYDFILENTKKYDLICMDIFVDQTIPVAFESDKFLQALLKSLNRDGILIYNRLAESEHDILKNSIFYNEKFSPIFSNHEILKLKTNWMFIGRR